MHPDGRLFRLVSSFTVADGRVTGVFNQLNPDKLGHLPPRLPDDPGPPPG
ncbi:hypothetical protein ACFY3U_14950 [Micromonospora sp. NPDC000089]